MDCCVYWTSYKRNIGRGARILALATPKPFGQLRRFSMSSKRNKQGESVALIPSNVSAIARLGSCSAMKVIDWRTLVGIDAYITCLYLTLACRFSNLPSTQWFRRETTRHPYPFRLIIYSAQPTYIFDRRVFQNDLSEYFSLLNFANPNYLGTKNDFKKNFENRIIRGRDVSASDAIKAESEKNLKELGGVVIKFIIWRPNDLLSKYRKFFISSYIIAPDFPNPSTRKIRTGRILRPMAYSNSNSPFILLFVTLPDD